MHLPPVQVTTAPQADRRRPRTTTVDLGDRSPRDPRLVWARFLLPRQLTFRNPTARLLGEWADAIEHDDSWEAFLERRPDGIDLEIPTEPDR